MGGGEGDMMEGVGGWRGRHDGGGVGGGEGDMTGDGGGGEHGEVVQET